MNTFVGKQLEKMTLEFPFEDIKETEEEKKTGIKVQSDSRDYVKTEETESCNKDITVVLID